MFNPNIEPGKNIIFLDRPVETLRIGPVFKEMGIEVRTTEDLDEARSFALEDPPATIIISTHMPPIQAAQFLEMLSVTRHGRTAAMYSDDGFTDPSRVAFLRLKGNSVIGKPYQVAEILTEMERQGISMSRSIRSVMDDPLFPHPEYFRG